MSEGEVDRRKQLLKLIKAENPITIGWLISDLYQHLADVHVERLKKLLAEGPIAALYISASWVHEEDSGENYLPLQLEMGLDGTTEIFDDAPDDDSIDRIGAPDHWAAASGRGFPDYNSDDEQPHKAALMEALSTLHSHLYYQGHATVRNDAALLVTREGISYSLNAGDVPGHLSSGATASQIIAFMGSDTRWPSLPSIGADEFGQMLAIDPVAAKKIVLEGPLHLTPELQDAIAAHDARQSAAKTKRLAERMR